MATIDIKVEGRARGLWRVRLLAWLSDRLLPGAYVEQRIDGGEWRPIPLVWQVQLTLE